jgi:glycine cleavage system aminomethyltransferase T
MKIESDAPLSTAPARGTPIHAGDRQVGQITSAVVHPETGRALALGYIARDSAVEGAAVMVAGVPAHTVSFTG